MLAIAIAKYFIVCVYKSIVMNDDFVAMSLFLIIYSISFSFAFVMTMSPGKPPLNYVSNMLNVSDMSCNWYDISHSWFVLERSMKNG